MQSPTRVVEKDGTENHAADMDMHIDWDIDVDLGLDMDLDPVQEEKPRVSASPEAVQRSVVQRPARPAVSAPRGLISAQTLARPTARPTTVSPAVSAGSGLTQRKEASPNPAQVIEQLPAAIVPPPPVPAAQQVHPSADTATEQDGTQDQTSSTTTLLPLPLSEAASAPVAPVNQSSRSEEFSPPAEHTRSPAAAVPTSAANAAPIEAPVGASSPPAPLISTPAEVPAPRAPSSIAVEQPLQEEPVLGPQDEVRDGAEEVNTNGHTSKESDSAPAHEAAVANLDQSMDIDSLDMQPVPLAAEQTTKEQQVEVQQPALPMSSPPPMPPPSASPPQLPPPPALANDVLPAPPSISPPPLPESSPLREVPPPQVSVLPEPDVIAVPRPDEQAEKTAGPAYVPTPDDSLPVVPPVPAGGGKLQLEVVIDETEFANSTDGYFKRFCVDIHPQDLHPNDTLAAYGFTKYFAEHLLNKRVVVMSTIAKAELRQLVVDAGGTWVHFGSDDTFDIMLFSNDLYAGVAEEQAVFEFTSGNRELWSFGPADDLDPPQWRLKRRIPKRSGLVSFCANAIIKSPDQFLQCLKKIDALPNWSAFLSANTIRSVHNYIRHDKTPRSLQVQMFKTMNDATGHFQVRYPPTDDRLLKVKRQQVIRKTARFNRWIDVQQEVMRDPDLMKSEKLCTEICAAKKASNDQKYWERDAEILLELQKHQTNLDEVYAVRRSIFAGFDHSTIRKAMGEEAIAELGYPDVEGYRMEDLERDLSRNVKFAALLLPSERMATADEDE